MANDDDNTIPFPGMPTPPEPKLSEKALETLKFLADMELSAEEVGEVIGAMLLSKLTGSMSLALKAMGVDPDGAS